MNIRFIVGFTICFLLSSFTTSNYSPQVTIYMIGDSTMADKSLANENQERGWGQMLYCFLKENVVVYNYAVDGQSSRSFINDGKWNAVLSKLKKGDYVFIQFGHNDEKEAENLHTVPGGSFDENLELFVRETRSKGAYPVLFNSIVRRNYPPSGLKEHQYTYEKEGDILIDTHGEYAEVPRCVAKKMDVPFIDMTLLTHDLVANMGAEESKKIFMWIPKNIYSFCPEGKVDNTHLNIYGAKRVAQVAAEAIGETVPELLPFICLP